MIPTLKTLDGFRTKAQELGFELPAAVQYEIPEDVLNGFTRRGRPIGVVTPNYVQRDYQKKFKEIRSVKYEPDGSKKIFAGVFNMNTGEALQIELSHVNNSNDGFSLLGTQKERIKNPARILLEYGTVDFKTNPNTLVNDGISNTTVDEIIFKGVDWHQPKITVIPQRR